MKGLFITGTNTAVGKTFIGCQLIKALRTQNIAVKVRKPIETDCNPDPKDAMTLKAAANSSEPLDIICRYQFNTCASAAFAAEKAQQSLSLNALVAACKQDINEDDFVIVEGAGGLYSPLTTNTLNADLAQALDLDLLLVTKDELGCLSPTLLSIEAIKTRQLRLSAVILNTFQQNNLDNLTALKHYSTEQVIAYPNSKSFAAYLQQLMIVKH